MHNGIYAAGLKGDSVAAGVGGKDGANLGEGEADGGRHLKSFAEQRHIQR